MRGIAIVWLAGAAASAPVCAETFGPAGIESVIIGTEAGEVAVEAGGPEIKVEVTKPDAERCRVTMAPDGGRLVLRAERRKARWFGKGCGSGFRVTAPATLRVELSTVSGDSKVAGMKGGLDLHSVSGAARLTEIAGSLELNTTSGEIDGDVSAARAKIKTVSGDVRLTGLTGGVTADSVSGRLRLVWSGAPPSGRVKVDTVSGDIELEFPRETRMRVDLDSTSGETRSQFGEDDDAPLKVSADSISGDVSVLKPKRS
ncbi:MAG: DUF4097 family beta strand repeat protein [Elusimicrobia bacterium]|nr:DUF4097 family beta strand repeat protein [Elusimicrobiota bacterium]